MISRYTLWKIKESRYFPQKLNIFWVNWDIENLTLSKFWIKSLNSSLMLDKNLFSVSSQVNRYCGLLKVFSSTSAFKSEFNKTLPVRMILYDFPSSDIITGDFKHRNLTHSWEVLRLISEMPFSLATKRFIRFCMRSMMFPPSRRLVG